LLEAGDGMAGEAGTEVAASKALARARRLLAAWLPLRGSTPIFHRESQSGSFG
jgi:hypothetical protein